jgi:hypothetical protein
MISFLSFFFLENASLRHTARYMRELSDLMGSVDCVYHSGLLVFFFGLCPSSGIILLSEDGEHNQFPKHYVFFLEYRAMEKVRLMHSLLTFMKELTPSKCPATHFP